MKGVCYIAQPFLCRGGLGGGIFSLTMPQAQYKSQIIKIAINFGKYVYHMKIEIASAASVKPLSTHDDCNRFHSILLAG